MSSRAGKKLKVQMRKPKRALPLAVDQKLAGQLRRRMVPHLEAICKLMDEASASGLYMGFNLAPSAPDGLNHIQHINITRLL